MKPWKLKRYGGFTEYKSADCMFKVIRPNVKTWDWCADFRKARYPLE